MFTRFAALAGALLLAGAPAFASPSSDPTLEWKGDINNSCSITAGKKGKVGLSADRKYLTSTHINNGHAELHYDVIGGSGTIKSTTSSVKRGNQELLSRNNTDPSRLVKISYDGGNTWHQVWQGHSEESLNNQTGKSITGKGQLEVDVQTDAHIENNKAVSGSYTVKTTVTCIL